MGKIYSKIIRFLGLRGRAYLAGCIDCDGYITIKRSTYHMRVRGDASCPVYSERIGLKQTTPEIADMLHSAFGGYRSLENPSALRGKRLHSWQVTDRQAYLCAKVLYPFLKIKKRQAEILFELRESKERTAHIRTKETNVPEEERALREKLFNEIKSLNDIRPNQAKLI